MSPLATLQAGFQAYLLDDSRKTAFKPVVDDNKVGATQRLKIYHNAYRLRIVGAFAAAYPMLQAYLGDDAFANVARSYLTKTPSIYPNMRWYGAQMPAHLLSVLAKHPIAAELAQFEWTLSLAFDAEDTTIINLQDLARIPPENWGDLRFKFQPSTHLLALHYNAVAVWQALNVEQTPPQALKQEAVTHWLIWRQDLTCKFRLLASAEVQAIEMALAGKSFGDICETLFETLGDEAVNQAAQYLAGWLEAGLLCEWI